MKEIFDNYSQVTSPEQDGCVPSFLLEANGCPDNLFPSREENGKNHNSKCRKTRFSFRCISETIRMTGECSHG